MSYSILGNISPGDFGSGQDDVLGFFGRFNQSATGALNSGMKLGTAFTQYGMQQRLAGAAEDLKRQQLNTGLIGSQNEMLRGVTSQQVEYCRALGGNSSFCRRLQMVAQGLLPPGAQNTPHPGDDDYRGGMGASVLTGPVDTSGFVGPIDNSPIAGPMSDTQEWW